MCDLTCPYSVLNVEPVGWRLWVGLAVGVAMGLAVGLVPGLAYYYIRKHYPGRFKRYHERKSSSCQTNFFQMSMLNVYLKVNNVIYRLPLVL